MTISRAVSSNVSLGSLSRGGFSASEGPLSPEPRGFDSSNAAEEADACQEEGMAMEPEWSPSPADTFEDPPGSFSLDFAVSLRAEDLEAVPDASKVGPGMRQELRVADLRKEGGAADLDPVVSQVLAQVYGPLPSGEAAEERWKEVNVETIWNQDFTDDQLTRKVSYIGTKLQVFAEPQDFCTPLWNALPEELPVDLHAKYCPPSIEVLGTKHWKEVTAALPHNQADLDAETERRLQEKLRTELPPEDAFLQRRLMMEGAMGLWELSTQKYYVERFTDPTLEALVHGIDSGIPDVAWAASAAAWHAVESVGLRSRLVRAGVVPALIQLLQRALKMKRRRRWRRAMMAHSLGALAVLSVDQDARRDIFAQDPGLRSLVDAALMPLDENLDAPSPPPTPPLSPPPEDEGEHGKDGPAAGGEAASAAAQPSAGHFEINMEESGEDAEDAAAGPHQPAPEETTFPLCEEMLDLSQEHFSPRWRQKCAVDTLCGLLVRDVDGRVVFSQARGSAALVDLHSIGDAYVDEVVTHILGALARDNRPRGEGIPLGVVLVAESGQDMVQSLLLKVTADLQADLQRKLRAAAAPPPSAKPPRAPKARSKPPPEPAPPADADEEAPKGTLGAEAALAPEPGPTPAEEEEEKEEDAAPMPTEANEGPLADKGAEERAAPEEEEEEAKAPEAPGADEPLELLASAVWGTAGAAMRPGMGGLDRQFLMLILKSAYDAVELQARHGKAMHRVLHCLTGCLYLAARDPSAAKLLMQMHEAAPELDPVAILQTISGWELMGGSKSIYKPEGHVRILAAASLTGLAVHDDARPKAMGAAKDAEQSLSGPYRSALRDAGTIPVMLATTTNLPRDGTWATQLQQLCACCVMYLCTVEAPFDRAQFDELIEFLTSPVIWDLPTASYLAAAFWCLVRVPANLAYVLKDPEEKLVRRIVTMVNLHSDDLDETVAASIAREALKKQRAEMRAAAERGELSSYMGGLKGDANQASLGQRSMRSFATNRSRQVQGWGFASEAESPAMKLSEYAVATLWIIVHKQLTDAAKAAKAKEMYKEDELSWWGVKMHAETTTAPLTAGQTEAVQLMAELLATQTCHATVILKTTVVNILWSLSHASPRVEDMVVESELGGELMAIVEDLTLSSTCQQAAVGFLLLLCDKAETLEQIGGANKLAQVVIDLTNKSVKAMAINSGGASDMDLDLLEFSVRGMARMSTTKEGRKAIVRLNGVKALAAAMRADLLAMEHLQRLADGQDWGAVYPLRRAAALQRTFGPLDDMSAEDAEDEGVADILRSMGDLEVEDGDSGLLALWALLNLSTYDKAQRHIARNCIFSLLKLTYLSPNPTKAAVASHILSHIRKHPENVTVFYKAELQLKTKFLVGASGVPSGDRDLVKIQPPEIQGHELPPDADVEEGLPSLLEVDEGERAAMADNERARLQFLSWANDQDAGPDSMMPKIADEKSSLQVPFYMVDAEKRAKRKAKESGTQSRRDRQNLREYQDKLEGAFDELGEIRSYRGKFMRQTLFQTLQAHAASMWSHAHNADAPEEPELELVPEATNEGWAEGSIMDDSDSADSDFIHPDDQEFLEAQRVMQIAEGQGRPQSGKKLVRQLSSARRARPGSVPPGGRVSSAKPSRNKSRPGSSGPTMQSPTKPSAAGPQGPSPLKNRKSSAQSARPGSAVVTGAMSPRPPSNSKALKPYNRGARASSALSSKTAVNHKRPSTAPSQRPAQDTAHGARPKGLVALREMAAVCPSLMALEPASSAGTASSDGRQISRSAITPRPLSSRPISHMRQSSISGAGVRSASAATPMRGRSAGKVRRSNWEPKVEFYAQDITKASNPSDVSRKLLMAECPEDTESRLRNASAKLAADPSLITDLMRPTSPTPASRLSSAKNLAMSERKEIPLITAAGQPLEALVSAEDVGAEPEDAFAEEAAEKAREKIGRGIHLTKPKTGYDHPHHGNVNPVGEMISSLWDPELPKSLQRSAEEMRKPPEDLPRPVTMIPPEDRAIGEPPEAHEGHAHHARHLKVALAEHEKEPTAVYSFKEQGAGVQAPIIIFEHVDGCKFCQNLYGHFLLPNGKLGHYYLNKPGLRRGRFVALSTPPTPAFTLKGFLQPGFLMPPEFIKDLRHPGRPVVEFAKLTAFPLPPLAPCPQATTLRVRAANEADTRFPKGWRLAHGPGMKFTAKPYRVDRLDTLIIKLADDVTEQLDLKSSVFAEREAECDARSFFDSPSVGKEQAEKDVSQLDRCPGFRMWVEKCAPGGYKGQMEAIKKGLVDCYDAVLQLYDYYGCVGDGSFFHLSLKEYRMLLNDLGVINEDSPSCTRAKCLSHYKDIMANCRIPIYLPKPPAKKGKKKKKKADEGAAAAAPARKTSSAKPVVEEPMMNRPEFAQVIVRLAVHVFGTHPDPDPEAPPGTIQWDPDMDVAQCVKRLVHEVMVPRLPKAALGNANEFRFKRLYTKEVNEALEGDYSLPTGAALKLLFTRQSVRRKLGTADTRLMQMTTWLELLDIVGLIGPSPMGLQISAADAKACYMLSKMRVANDTLDILRHEGLTYCEFLEAIARVADCISWPEHDKLDSMGFSGLYDYLKADLKTRPRLTKAPSFGMLNEKSRPLAGKIKQLSMLLLQVFAEMAMFSPERLLKKMTKEVKKKKIRTRKHVTDYTVGTSCRGGLQFSNPPSKKKKPPPPKPEE